MHGLGSTCALHCTLQAHPRMRPFLGTFDKQVSPDSFTRHVRVVDRLTVGLLLPRESTGCEYGLAQATEHAFTHKSYGDRACRLAKAANGARGCTT
eukprot:351626-Chlamydomonas_euryale.AAC.2